MRCRITYLQDRGKQLFSTHKLFGRHVLMYTKWRSGSQLPWLTPLSQLGNLIRFYPPLTEPPKSARRRWNVRLKVDLVTSTSGWKIRSRVGVGKESSYISCVSTTTLEQAAWQSNGLYFSYIFQNILFVFTSSNWERLNGFWQMFMPFSVNSGGMHPSSFMKRLCSSSLTQSFNVKFEL